MKYLLIPILGLFITVFSFLLSPFLMIIAVFFIKWDSEETTQPHRAGIPVSTIMGDLPRWLSFLGTPDQRLPGDLAIESVKAIFDKYGKAITSWYWLGIRNQMMNLAIYCGDALIKNPVLYYIPEEPDGFWSRPEGRLNADGSWDYNDQLWRYSKTFGSFKFVTGWQVYKMIDEKTFKAAPVFTLKRK